MERSPDKLSCPTFSADPDPVEFVVPGAPVAFARMRPIPRPGASGKRFYKPDAQRQYALSVGWMAKRAMEGRPWLEGPLRLTIIASWLHPAGLSQSAAVIGVPHEGKPDWDNVGKLVSDALNKIVWRDDAQVADARVIKRWRGEAGLHVKVERIK